MTANLSSYVGAIPFFVYLIYLVGRTYVTTYLSQLGVPGIIKLDFSEYVFYGTRIDTLVICLIFTGIFLGLIRYLKYEPVVKNGTIPSQAPKVNKRAPNWLKKTNEFNEKMTPYIGYVYFIWGAFVLVISIFMFAGSEAPYHPAQIMFVMVPLIILVGFSIFILPDARFIVWMKSRKRMSKLFALALIIQLVFFPPISSMAWGAFKGYADNRNLESVEILAGTPIINSVEWTNNSFGNFTNADVLYLIFADKQYVIVRSKETVINILNTSDIISFSVNETKLSSIYAPR